MIPQKVLFLRLCACILIAKQHLSKLPACDPAFETEALLLEILKEYGSCKPDKLEVLQEQSLTGLIVVVFSVHVNLAREYEKQIDKIVDPFSDTVLQSVLPDYKKNLAEIRAASNWIKSACQKPAIDPTFISDFILKSETYLAELDSKALNLKTIYELILISKPEFKRKKRELQLKLWAIIISAFLGLLIPALALLISYLELKK